MSDKSYVTMEQHKCMVCGKDFDTGALLLDQRLREVFDRNTVTGWGLCGEHLKLYDDGYIALIGVDESKSGPHGDTIKPEDAYRTGRIAHVRREVWPRIFDVPLPEKEGKPLPCVFVQDAVIDLLQQGGQTDEQT